MTLADTRFTAPRPKYWTKEQYRRLEGIPQAAGEPRFYLLRGELIEVPAMNQPHVWSVNKCNRWAIRQFDPGCVVRSQAPLDVPGDSMPEPDLSIVTHEENARPTHPRTALLVIEVAETSLYDDRKKAAEYAAAGVPIYWIIDVKRRVMEVRTQIIDDPQSPTGKSYATLQTLGETDTAETFDPAVRVPVSDLLP